MQLPPGLRYLSLLPALTCAVLLHAQTVPPAAAINPVTDDYYGTKVVDPYRYMEDVNSPALKDFLKIQGDYTRKQLDAIPGRAALLQQIIDKIDAAPAVYDQLTRRGDRIFYRKR